MPTLKKLLSKFSREEQQTLESLVGKIISSSWRGLDIKKLKGYQDIFRLRKGKLRIIFTKSNKSILILAIDNRSEKTYKF